MNNPSSHPFFTTFNGSFSGILRWHQLDELWERLRLDKENWYIYAVGEQPPQTVSSAESLEVFINEIDTLLRQEHEEDYCGIVYVDNREKPAFIKIFDPNNLGVSCGASSKKPLPGWILSKLQPINLPEAFPQTGSRKRWWQKVLSK